MALFCNARTRTSRIQECLTLHTTICTTKISYKMIMVSRVYPLCGVVCVDSGLAWCSVNLWPCQDWAQYSADVGLHRALRASSACQHIRERDAGRNWHLKGDWRRWQAGWCGLQVQSGFCLCPFWLVEAVTWCKLIGLGQTRYQWTRLGT